MSFTDNLKGMRQWLRRELNPIIIFNGIAGERTADTYLDEHQQTKKHPKIPARILATAATTATLIEGAWIVGHTAAVHGDETLALGYKTATEFLAANTIIPATSLIGGIATTAGATLALGMITAGAIDFIIRISLAPKDTFFKIETFREFLAKLIGCITSATAIPSVSLLIAHSILWIGSVINAMSYLLSAAEERNPAWNEVSKNSRALCFYLAAIVLMPLTNIIDLMGALVYTGYKGLSGCFDCGDGRGSFSTISEEFLYPSQLLSLGR